MSNNTERQCTMCTYLYYSLNEEPCLTCFNLKGKPKFTPFEIGNLLKYPLAKEEIANEE